jgi:toxin FitB
MAFLLDTNVISEPKQKAPNPQVLNWLAEHTLETTFISVVSLGELEQGITLLGKTKRAASYREWLETRLKAEFAGRILDLDGRVMTTWGRVTGEAVKRGRPVSLMDSLLAATAITHGLTLVTRNTKDVAALPVQVLNPGQG